jgi:nucleoside-diphosphate-sugar epimerase
VARTPEKARRLERLGAAPAVVDLFYADAVRRAVDGHEAVVNLATAIPPAAKAFLPGAWTANDRIRRTVSATLAEAARATGVARLVQEAFAPVYADGSDAWLDEHAPLDPAPHTRSALDAEAVALRFDAGDGTGVVLRFGFFDGAERGFTADTVRAVRKGRAPAFGHADGYYPAIMLDDAATAVLTALTLPGGVYNVVDDEPLTRRAYFDALAEALGVPPPRFFPAWPARLLGSLGDLMTRSQRVSNRTLRAASGWTPRYSSAREGWPVVVAAMAA